LEQKLFVTFGLAPTQMKLSSVPASMLTVKQEKSPDCCLSENLDLVGIVAGAVVRSLQTVSLGREGQKT
jgi:hypothetical protein